MTVGKKTFRLVTFEKPDGNDETQEQVIKLYEGGAAGYVSAYIRRTAGTGEGYVEVYGTFKSEPTDDDLYELNSYWWDDSLNYFMDGYYNEFPYLAVRCYPDDTNPFTVEVYFSGF